MDRVERLKAIKNLQGKIAEANYDLMYFTKQLEELTADMVKCSNCGAYFGESEAAIGTYVETTTEITFTDAGYGDDDLIAEVTRSHRSARCPRCGKEFSHTSAIVSIANERHRK